MSASLGQGDQIVVHRGVAGEHDGAVRGVETVPQSRNRMAVRHRDGGDPDRSVVENHDRNPGDALRPGRDVNVDAPDQRAGVRHAGVQRHDVQVVGVSGQDALDQVSRARGRSFGINGRLTVEERIAFRQRFGARRPVDPDRRERAVRVLADAPRVENQAG